MEKKYVRYPLSGLDAGPRTTVEIRKLSAPEISEEVKNRLAESDFETIRIIDDIVGALPEYIREQIPRISLEKISTRQQLRKLSKSPINPDDQTKPYIKDRIKNPPD